MQQPQEPLHILASKEPTVQDAASEHTPPAATQAESVLKRSNTQLGRRTGQLRILDVIHAILKTLSLTGRLAKSLSSMLAILCKMHSARQVIHLRMLHVSYAMPKASRARVYGSNTLPPPPSQWPSHLTEQSTGPQHWQDLPQLNLSTGASPQDWEGKGKVM